MRTVAYCSAMAFEMQGLFEYLKNRFGARRYRETIHLKLGQTEKCALDGDVFILPYGSVVSWNLEPSQERSLLFEIKPWETQSLESLSDDVFTYQYGAKAEIKDDNIILPDDQVLTKLAFSHGLAQSVKLDTFENTIKKTIHLTREMPELLAKKGKISLSRTDIRRMMGRLFIDRSSINLHQELLDTPDFFWDHTEIEPYYKLVAHYLDRERRVNVLNQRLKIVQELFDILNAELNHQHSSILEWIVIVLICFEVAISLWGLFHK